MRACPEDECKAGHDRLGAAAEADDLQALDVVVLKRPNHLVEEVGKVGWEVVRKIGKAEALEALGCSAAELCVVGEMLKNTEGAHILLPTAF